MSRILVVVLFTLAVAAPARAAVARDTNRVCAATPPPSVSRETAATAPREVLHKLYLAAFDRTLKLYGLAPEPQTRSLYRRFLRAQQRFADSVYGLQLAVARVVAADSFTPRLVKRAVVAFAEAGRAVLRTSRKLGAPACGSG